MKSEDYWQMFMETGVPEYYLLYNKAMKVENVHVFDGKGTCPEGNSL